MKKVVFLLAIAFSTLTFAQEAEQKMGTPSGNASLGDVYGAQVSAALEKSAVSPALLQKKLNR